MKEPVIIKSGTNGISVVLDKELPFSDLLEYIAKKFKESAKFFKNAKVALTIEGRELTEEQERAILNIISENSELEVICLLDKDEMRNQMYKKAVEEKIAARSTKDGQFYKGTLRSGQVFEAESSIIILGDVNPGATVISTGNIVVLGTLKGTAYAGGNGNLSAFVVALEMNPVQIRIGNIIARSSDAMKGFSKKKNKKDIDPKIAFVEDNNIYIESITKEILNDISLNKN